MTRIVQPPESSIELLTRAYALAGVTILELAESLGVILPHKLLHGKGITGQLLEQCLGATAQSKAQPDFVHLGIELKTIPVNSLGKPLESTYVCTTPLTYSANIQFEESVVYQKIRHVLWVPIITDKKKSLSNRRIGTALLWQPTPDDLAILRTDWEEHMEQIMLGDLEKITAHQGVYLQIRPKAANSRARRLGINSDGNLITTLPRGFYLRPQFTQMILQKNYW